MVCRIKICVYKLCIGYIKFYRLFLGRVKPHSPRRRVVAVFKRTYAESRMQIQRNFKPLLMQEIQKAPVIGEKLGVPAVSGPSV